MHFSTFLIVKSSYTSYLLSFARLTTGRTRERANNNEQDTDINSIKNTYTSYSLLWSLSLIIAFVLSWRALMTLFIQLSKINLKILFWCTISNGFPVSVYTSTTNYTIASHILTSLLFGKPSTSSYTNITSSGLILLLDSSSKLAVSWDS